MPNFGYQPHPSFTTPSDDTIVYHSIPLDYFKEARKNVQLRFASVLSYKDSFEGRFPYPNELSIGNWLISINNNRDPVFGPYETVSNRVLGEILGGRS